MGWPPSEWAIEPDPVGCRVEPRDRAFFAPFVVPDFTWRNPKGPEPGPLPDGAPADAATVAAVLSVLRQRVACYQAGERRRFFALFTDGFLRRQCERSPMFETDLRKLAEPPTPRPPDPAVPRPP